MKIYIKKSTYTYIFNVLWLALGLLFFTCPVNGETSQEAKNSTNNSLTDSDNSVQFSVFPVGINIERRTVNTSALVKGAEDGLTAVNFEQWLIPFDLVIEALQIKVTTLDNGILELRSPGLVKKIDPQKLLTDQDLGLVFKVSEIREILGVPVEFDIQEYAIKFAPPWLNLVTNNKVAELPIDLTGLTKVDPARFTFTSLGQKLRVNNSDLGDRDFDSQSNLKAIGTIFGGSWYAQVNQSDLTDVESWQLGELQYLRQTDTIDYALGSQSPFWQSASKGQYWGWTTIKRFGFIPDRNSASRGFNANLRRQPEVINRGISGTAQPEDVVHLVTKRRQEVLQEIIVDQTGIYQFDDVDSRQNDYQILIYPNGRLTVTPEVREVILTHVSGQLSAGTSTVAASLGMKRNFSGDSFLGKFANLGGGVSYRRGVREQLTVGTGLVVDNSLFALGEFFYQPNNVPLQLGISTLINPELKDFNYTAYFNYQPTDKFNLNFNGNSSNHNLRLNWRASPSLSLRAGNDNRDNITLGLTFRHNNWLGEGKNKQQFSLLTSMDYGDRQGLNQRIDTRFNTLQFSHQGDRDATFSRLSYHLSNNAAHSRGQSIFLGYDTRNSSHSNNVINLGWHYRSEQNSTDGGNLWDLELGYGFNNQGSAPIAALTTRAIAGTTLRLSYQGISPVNDNSRLRIDIFPNLRLQGRPRLGDRNMTKLRTQGGLFVRPFADQNNNGQLDQGEKIHTADAELLLIVNHKSLESIRNDITQQGVFVPLPPGEYRLDLDPAGYPFNLSPTESSYGVQVTAGSYTKLNIPFNPSYTVVGTVTDSQGTPVAGARVQAVASKSSQSVFSITNSAGVYFLEGLTQDTYNITVNDQSVAVQPLKITADSEPLQEFNLQLAI